MRRCAACGILVVTIGALSVARGWAAEPQGQLSVAALDALLNEELPDASVTTLIGDEQFLRRASLDLIGRNPTPGELVSLTRDGAPDRRSRVVDRLLNSPEYGKHWANYWSDTISFRVVPPKEVFLDYRPLQRWLAQQLNSNVPWDRITRQLITATGRIAQSPQVTYLTYHSAKPTKLAAETARIFLGVQIGCAQCHDHPFDVWKMDQFHGVAAAFGRIDRTKAKGGAIDGIREDPQARYRMEDPRRPEAGEQEVSPRALTGELLDSGQPRVALAQWLTSADNPWFARAQVNRVWAELMGRGFYDPVDDLSPRKQPALARTHAALARSFVDSGYDFKALIRLIVLSRPYQRQVAQPSTDQLPPFAAAYQTRLRGDQVCDCLSGALGVDFDQPWTASSGRQSKYWSSRDRVAERFGRDPSLGRLQAQPTIGQALLLMNNPQLQAAINGDSASGTQLAKLLLREPTNRPAVKRLYLQVLSRDPTPEEMEIALEHVDSLSDRRVAFEDLLWSLINSTEFLTRD